MENIREILSQLNEEQYKPVVDIDGAVLVIAGAGSGKTRVLTSRIAYLLGEKNVSPFNVMAITFTNKAANEMKSRLAKMLGNISGLWVSTIHSMCVRILRSDIEYLGFDKNFTIYDETDKEKVLKRVIDELNYERDKYFKLALSHISTAKNECLSPEEYRTERSDLRMIDEICNIYSAYDMQLTRNNALDFDDLLFKTYQLFLKFPEVADKYAKNFKYIHVDEFQDTNKVQFWIINRLASVHKNIFVVGDDDQSIYGWRGAKIENILHFDKIYPGAKIYKLERNYRSTKKIIELANCIIKNNQGRREKELWTNNSEGFRIESFIGDDENSEASYVAMQIRALIDRNSNLSYGDFAVFMRLNAISRAFEQEFSKYAIPYKVFGGFRFYERKEIKDVMSYLKVVNNRFDDESFLRAVSVPKRGIGEKTLTEVKEFASANGYCIMDAINRLDETTISSGAKLKLKNFKDLILSFLEFSKTNSISDLIKHVLDTTCFLDMFAEKNDENQERVMNISELVNSAELYEKDNGESASLSEFLNNTTLSSDTDQINEGDAVTVATIHAVKGLEYPIVFVAGLDEKVLPSARTLNDEDELEEERRLMYVAVTRAKERLYLTRASSRFMYGKREYMIESRFLREGRKVLNPNFDPDKNRPTYGIEERFERNIYGKDESLPSKNYGYSSSYAKSMLKDSKPIVQQKNNLSEYRLGSKVKHVKFGTGTIIEVSGIGENVTVSVAFLGIGIKKLSVKYAPMEIINE